MATSLKELIVSFEANARPVINALNQVDAKLKHTTRSLRSTGESFSNLGKELGMILSLPVAALGGASVKAVADIQSLEASLTSVLEKFNIGTPIQQAVTSEIEHLKSVTNELGVSFSASVKPYVRYLAASKDSLETNRKVMKSFLGLSTALGLSSDDLTRVIRALEQMQSLGTVMSQELKLQLGDALPGAVGLFAEAMGVGETELFKLMEQGKVSSKILSKVADIIDKKYSAAIENGSKTIRANTNRIGNALYFLRVNIGKGMEETFKINEKMASFGKWLTKVSDNFARLDDSGKKTLLSIGLFLAILGPLLIALGAISKILGIAVLGFGLLTKPIVLLIGFLPKIIASFKALTAVMIANPLAAFIAATALIIFYWKDIVELFDKAYDWITKISLSDIWDKIKNFLGFSESLSDVWNGIKKFTGFGDVDINSGAKSSMVNSNSTNSISNNKTINTNNNLTVNIPAGVSSSDAVSVKNAIKQALREENRQAYIELGAQ